MALSVRKRGQVWHARGSIRVGRQKIDVPEFSTGASSRADAEAAAAAEEARLRQEHLDGPAGKARRLTFADCALHYLKRPGGVKQYDKDRLGVLIEAMGDVTLPELSTAWTRWVGDRNWQLGTAARWRATANAAVMFGCKAEAVPPLELPRYTPVEDTHVVSLNAEQRLRLLAAYNPHAACPALLLAYAGLRSQEALQLNWRDVDFHHSQMRIHRGKTKLSRIVAMHPKVRLLLVGLWEAAARPHDGAVFISAKGKPYANTKGKGGNPLTQAHETACRIAGVTNFRPHDWRHDFALRFLRRGGDVRSLMQVMGWTVMRMAQRYVTYKGEHLAEVMRLVD